MIDLIEQARLIEEIMIRQGIDFIDALDIARLVMKLNEQA